MQRSNILEITAGLFVLVFTIFLVCFAVDKLSDIKKAIRIVIKYMVFLLTLMA
jgi:phospholipid/cholesterol/gamma-HCH transport system substrate-binding protein